MVRFGLFGSPPGHGVTDTAWDLPMLGIVGGGWLLLHWYLKTLSHRLGDRTLRKNFMVLFWLCAALLVVTVLAVTRGSRTDDGGIPAPSATAPAAAQEDGRVTFVGFAGWMACHAWMGWLMWRLSRRLNQCAGYYRQRAALPPTGGEPPG